MIGLAASLLLYFNGRIAGISGILSNAIRKQRQFWQLLFLAGLIIGTALVEYATPVSTTVREGFPLAGLIVAGLLVGMGTRLGSGCTSGHGICGLSRLSWRSITATITFMLFGFISTFVARHLLNLT